MSSQADLSRLVALIPVRSLSGAKTRLGEPLDPEERETLVRSFLEHAIAATRNARSVAETIVVSPDPAALALAAAAGATPLLQRTDGLNEGLAEARTAIAGRAGALLVLPLDLPGLSAVELDRIVAAVRARAPDQGGAKGRSGALVALVPDQHGTGTNVLLLAPPDAIEFRFGEGSRRLHETAAAAAGAVYVELDGPLSFDVDTPEDLLLAEQAGLGHDAGR